MRTLTTSDKDKSNSYVASPKSKRQPFFAPAKVQPKLTIGAVDDPYEREADAMADRVMRMPASGTPQSFFKPAPSTIQRQDDPTKTLTEGAGVVKDQLDDKPGFGDWKDKQTDALKKKVWDDQPTELKAGIIGFGLSSLGILGTVFGTNPGFRADTIKLLNDKNIAMPLSLIPYHEYFPLTSFKYKLASDKGAATEFSTEFEFKPYLDLMHQKWSFIPRTDITLGVDTAYSKSGGFGFTGGSIKVKFGGGIINLQGFLNQTLPATPMLVSGNNPGESPMWIMRSMPGQFDDQLPKGSGVFLTVDVLRLPELWKGDAKTTDVQRKSAVNDEENLQRKESVTNESASTSFVEQTLQSSGNPLDKSTKSFMEDRFGYDFSNVKIHTDSAAAKSAGSINALAYTSGSNIVFNQNQFAPGTESGKKLLAHELTHVVQQGNSNNAIQRDVVTMPAENITVGMPSDLSSLSTPAAAGSMTVAADPALIQLNSQLPNTPLPFTTGGWDGNRIANLLGQYDQIPGTDSDSVRCVQSVALMSHILMGPDAARTYLSSIALQGMLAGKFGTRERTALRVIDFVKGRIQSRQATFGNMYWAMEAVHDLFYKDDAGTPAATPGTMRDQITPALDLSQRMVNINIWCNNGAELLSQAATLNPGEQFMLNTWRVLFNYYFDEVGVPTTQQRLTYTQTDEQNRPLRTVNIRRINASRKPAATQIDLNRDHKSGHQMLIFKDAADSHIKMYEPELTSGGKHLFDLTNDPSVMASELFNDQPAFELYKYVQLLGKMVPVTMP